MARKIEFYIEIRKKLVRDGRVIAMGRKLSQKRVTILGALVSLWSLADDYAEEDGHLPGYSPDDIDADVEIPGFVGAMPPDWCQAEGGSLYLPNYQDHNGTTAKTRIAAAKRQRKCQAAKTSSHVSVKKLGAKCTDTDTDTDKEASNKLEAAAKRPSPSPTGYFFPMAGGKMWNLPARKLDEYRATYAADFDLDTELRKAKQWLMDNNNRRPKTVRGMPSFLTRWLNRTLESSARRMPGSRVADARDGRGVFNPETGEIVEPLEK